MPDEKLVRVGWVTVYDLDHRSVREVDPKTAKSLCRADRFTTTDPHWELETPEDEDPVSVTDPSESGNSAPGSGVAPAVVPEPLPTTVTA